MCQSRRVAHDPRCPAYGNPKWADVDECGPCDYLAQIDATPNVGPT